MKVEVDVPEGESATPRRLVIDALAMAAHLGMLHCSAMENSTGAEVTCAALTMALRIVQTAVTLGANRAQLRQAIGVLLLVASDDAVN